MPRNRRQLILLWCWMSLAAWCPSGFGAQEDGPDTAGLVKALKEQVADKQDAAAIKIIAQLLERFAEKASDQKPIAKALDSCLKRARDADKPDLHVAVLEAFAKMGDVGEKRLVKAIKLKTVTGSSEALAAGLRSLGSFASSKHVKTLSGFLVKRDPIVIRGASEALGHYRFHPQKQRKPIVETLIRNYSATAAQRTGSFAGTGRGMDQLIMDVRKSFQASLTRLTDVRLDSAALWRDWWSQNKKAKWKEFKKDDH